MPNKDNIEYRYLPIVEIETRSEDDGKMLIRGYAAVFESLSEPMWGFREKIQKGAFADSLKRDVIKAFWNHNSDYVLGSTRNKTLTLEEDEKGLRFELELPNTSWGRDANESIRRGDVDGVSFGFRTEKDQWEGDIQKPVRTLMKVRLFEVSPTPMPAYSQTSVSARSAEAALQEFEEFRKQQELAGTLTTRAKQHMMLDLIDKELV